MQFATSIHYKENEELGVTSITRDLFYDGLRRAQQTITWASNTSDGR
jgi:hypothetical protein